MAVSSVLYRNLLHEVFGSTTSGNAPNVDWLSDTIKVALLTSSYTPNANTHDFYNDLTNELSTANGYTSGGATLGSKTLTYTAANSWGTTWATGTAYTVGQIVRPTTGNTHLYRCIVAGTSHASTEPTWSTVAGQINTDNTVTWAECGGAITQFDAADTSWSSSTITARYAVVYDDTPGTSATKPLLLYVDFGADVSTTNGTFQITWDALGLFVTTS